MLFRRNADKAGALARVPLFQNLSKRDLARVSQIADEVRCSPGKVLMREGTVGKEFMLIAEGSVRVERGGRLIAHRGAGDFLGELALLDGEPRTATVIADEPCAMLVIHARQFWELLESVPGVQRKLLIGLAGRLREAESAHDFALHGHPREHGADAGEGGGDGDLAALD